jgi:hypothetical protein
VQRAAAHSAGGRGSVVMKDVPSINAVAVAPITTLNAAQGGSVPSVTMNNAQVRVPSWRPWSR